VKKCPPVLFYFKTLLTLVLPSGHFDPIQYLTLLSPSGQIDPKATQGLIQQQLSLFARFNTHFFANVAHIYIAMHNHTSNV